MRKLCGVKAREYTNATTMGMVNTQTGEFDTEILERLGYPKHLFPKLSKPLTDANSEAANYSNEGGVGYNRYQKNIMGMWLRYD